LAFSGSGGDSGTVYNNLGDFCLDDTGDSTTNGNPVQIYTCNGSSAQKWTPEPNGTVQLSSGHCLDDTNASTANNNPTQLYDCSSGHANQEWKLP
jgi:glucosylceramidase